MSKLIKTNPKNLSAKNQHRSYNSFYVIDDLKYQMLPGQTTTRPPEAIP
jgi:hypothetical protein